MWQKSLKLSIQLGLSSTLLAAVACGGNSGGKVKINRTLDPTKTEASGKDQALNKLIKDSRGCLPLDKVVGDLVARNDDPVTVYTSSLNLGLGADVSGKPFAATDDVTRAKILLQPKNPFSVQVIAGSSLLATPRVGELLSIVAQVDCTSVTFAGSVPGAEQIFKVEAAAVIRDKAGNQSGGSPSQLNLVSASGERRIYRDSGNGNLEIRVSRPGIPVAGCAGSALMTQIEDYVVAHGTDQNKFTLGRSFAQLIQSTLKTPPRELVSALKTPAQSQSSTATPARISNPETVQITSAAYQLILGALNRGEFNDLNCAKK